MNEDFLQRYAREQASIDKFNAVMLAKVKAMELAVATLIESHPNPRLALALWNMVHLDMSDESLEKGSMPGYQDQMKESLASWSRGFRAAADRGESGPAAPQA